MKSSMKISQRKVPQVDKEQINRRRKEHIKIVLAVKDHALSQFGVANMINKIMSKQANKKQK